MKKMKKMTLMLLLLSLIPVTMGARVPAWPAPYWDIPGQYCSAHYPTLACCPGEVRQDRCHVQILDTLCYCDKFCNR